MVIHVPECRCISMGAAPGPMRSSGECGWMSLDVAKKSGNRNRILDDRLWDHAGTEWRHKATGRDASEVLELLNERGVRAGVHQGWQTPVRWIAEREKMAVWRTEIQPTFTDILKQFDNPLPFRAQLWRSGEKKLLLFDDLD